MKQFVVGPTVPLACMPMLQLLPARVGVHDRDQHEDGIVQFKHLRAWLSFSVLVCNADTARVERSCIRQMQRHIMIRQTTGGNGEARPRPHLKTVNGATRSGVRLLDSGRRHTMGFQDYAVNGAGFSRYR
jgi:hypothetical protein